MTEKNTMAAGRIDDNAMQWKQGCMCLKPVNCEGMINNGTIDIGLGAGTPGMVAMIAASELSGLALDAADECYWLIDLEAEGIELDPSKDILAEVVCVHTGGAADTGIGGTVTIKGVGVLEAIADGKTTPDGSHAWTGIVTGITNAPVVFPKAPLKCAGELATYDADGNETSRDRFAIVTYTHDAIGIATADELFLRSVNLYYTRECCHQDGIRQVT